MATEIRFVDKFMHATNRLRAIFGPADRSDPNTPVVHRHDAAEAASDEQLAGLRVERDAQGNAWAEDK